MAVGSEGSVRYVNRAVCGLLGYEPEDFLGLANDPVGLVEKIVHPDDKEFALAELADAVGRPGLRSPVGVRVRRKDGSWRHFEGRIVNLGDDPVMGGLAFVARDVSERVRAEEEVMRLNGRLEERVRERTARLEETVARLKENEWRLEENEERFRLAFDAAAVGMAHVAPDGRWLRVNSKLCEIVGYEAQELLGLTFQDITHTEDLDADLHHFERMLRGEIKSYSMEKRYVRKNGVRIWIKLTVSWVSSCPAGQEYFVSVVEDITPLKLAELVPDPLTYREVDVLRQIVAGLTNQQIACKLLYSLGSVKLCVQCIISKLGVENRGQAAARAVEIGLVAP